MKEQTVNEIVKESIEFKNHFPKFNVIYNAIKDDHKLDDSFKNSLINYYIKEDDDLIKIIDLMMIKNFEFDGDVIFDLARNGFFKTMEYFNSLGYDLNIKDELNENALFYVIKRDVSKANHIDGWWRKNDFIENILENCIKLGIDEKHINNEGQNLLHTYALSGMPNIYFDALIKYKIDINRRDNNGWTPLHCICAYNSDDKEYKKFLKYGADKTIYTKKRITFFEEYYDVEPTPEVNSAYDLRLHFLNSIGGELSKGTEAYNALKKDIEFHLKP